MMSGILYESWLVSWLQDEIVPGNQMLLKNIILLAWILLLWDETLVQVTEDFSSALLLFLCDNALQCRNLKYLHILLSANH